MKVVSDQGSLSCSVMHALAKMVVNFDPFFSEGVVTEGLIAERFQVSRTVARESVKSLISKGMVISRQRLGIVPLDIYHWNLLDPDVIVWVCNSSYKVDILKDFMRFRLSVEPEAVKETVKTRSQKQLVEFEMLLLNIEKVGHSRSDLIENVASFHVNLVQSNENKFYRYLGESLRPLYELSFNILRDISKDEYVIDTHFYKTMFQRLLHKNDEGVQSLVREHILMDLDVLNFGVECNS